MIYEQLRKYLQALHSREEYQPKILFAEVTELEPLEIEDDLGEKYSALNNHNIKLEIGQQLVLKDYQFTLDYDFELFQLRSASLNTLNMTVQFDPQEFTDDMHLCAQRASLVKQFQSQLKPPNIPELRQLCEQYQKQQVEQQVKENQFEQEEKIQPSLEEIPSLVQIPAVHLPTPAHQFPQQSLQVYLRGKEEPDVLKQEAQQFINVEDASEPIDVMMSIQESGIKVPPRWDEQVEEWVDAHRKQKSKDSDYYHKLELLAQSLSKRQVIENMVQYPYKPEKSLARKMLHLLVNEEVLEAEVTKKSKLK